MNKVIKVIDKRNAVLISAVLIIASFIGFWLPYKLSKNSNIPINVVNKTSEITIIYDIRGFVPDNITVPIGTTVAWTSSSGIPMWVGSDPHPSHTDLPGFDQKRIINKIRNPFIEVAYAHGDGAYEYTFTKVGTWKYHNHLNPQHKGLVVVTEK